MCVCIAKAEAIAGAVLQTPNSTPDRTGGRIAISILMKQYVDGIVTASPCLGASTSSLSALTRDGDNNEPLLLYGHTPYLFTYVYEYINS